MPFVHGKGTEVLFGGLDLSPYLNATDFGIDVDTADSTVYKATWRTAIAGQNAGKVDFAGLYDPAELTMRNNLATDGGVLTYAPGGALSIGSPTRMIPVVATSYAESSPVGGIIALKWSVMAASGVGLGYMLHPLAEDTNTTTGADRDDGAASSTGWQAHLHVSLVDGAGSWVVKLQDAATLPTYADVTGGAFASVSAPGGGQRLLSASGTTTLRRFVRYVATRTGGSAGDGITFALSLARNV